MAEKTIIVEFGYDGTSRFGFHTDETPHEVSIDVREAEGHFRGDFGKLMNDAYQALGVVNPSLHPVLVIERDSFNNWRRVAQAEILLGERKAPWMYVMWTSMILAYGNNKNDLATAVVSHMEGSDVHETPVIYGAPLQHPYMNPPMIDQGEDCYYYEPASLERRADMIFWTAMDSPYENHEDLLDNIILSGKGWEQRVPGEADVLKMEARMDLQRFQSSHKASINRPSYPRRYCVWRASQKICNDGILIDGDLAFTRALYDKEGSGRVRTWIY